METGKNHGGGEKISEVAGNEKRPVHAKRFGNLINLCMGNPENLLSICHMDHCFPCIHEAVYRIER